MPKPGHAQSAGNLAHLILLLLVLKTETVFPGQDFFPCLSTSHVPGSLRGGRCEGLAMYNRLPATDASYLADDIIAPKPSTRAASKLADFHDEMHLLSIHCNDRFPSTYSKLSKTGNSKSLASDCLRALESDQLSLKIRQTNLNAAHYNRMTLRGGFSPEDVGLNQSFIDSWRESATADKDINATIESTMGAWQGKQVVVYLKQDIECRGVLIGMDDAMNVALKGPVERYDSETGELIARDEENYFVKGSSVVYVELAENAEQDGHEMKGDSPHQGAQQQPADAGGPG